MRDLPPELFIEKNGLAYNLDRLGFVERPFKFKNKYGFELNISTTEQPIFFGRRRKRVSDGKEVVDYIWRFCVGKIKSDGTKEKHWLSPQGEYIEPNLEIV